jgi:hypothetical protein
MGKAKEQELRVTALGMIALVVVTGLLTLMVATAFGAKWHALLSGSPAPQDLGGASATYVQR